MAVKLMGYCWARGRVGVRIHANLLLVSLVGLLYVSAYNYISAQTQCSASMHGLLVIVTENKSLTSDLTVDKVGQDNPNQKSWLRQCRCVAKKSSDVKYKGLSDYRRSGLKEVAYK